MPLDVSGAPTRCPYCHGEFRPADDVIACRSCVAKHHAGCWHDHGRCATCGATQFLAAPVAGMPHAGAGREGCAFGRFLAYAALLAGLGLLLQGVLRFNAMLQDQTPGQKDLGGPGFLILLGLFFLGLAVFVRSAASRV